MNVVWILSKKVEDLPERVPAIQGRQRKDIGLALFLACVAGAGAAMWVLRLDICPRRAREAIVAKILNFIHILGENNTTDILSKHCGYLQMWPHVQPLLFWMGAPTVANDGGKESIGKNGLKFKFAMVRFVRHEGE